MCVQWETLVDLSVSTTKIVHLTSFATDSTVSVSTRAQRTPVETTQSVFQPTTASPAPVCQVIRATLTSSVNKVRSKLLTDFKFTLSFVLKIYFFLNQPKSVDFKICFLMIK